MFAILPLAVGARVETAHSLGHEISQAANEFADPYQVPDANFGWSARDACYAYGSFVLEDDEALVITHRPPSCRFNSCTFDATAGSSMPRICKNLRFGSPGLGLAIGCTTTK